MNNTNETATTTETATEKMSIKKLESMTIDESNQKLESMTIDELKAVISVVAESDKKMMFYKIGLMVEQNKNESLTEKLATKANSGGKHHKINKQVHDILKVVNVLSQSQIKVKTGTDKLGKDIIKIKSRKWDVQLFSDLEVSQKDIKIKIGEIASSHKSNSSKPKIFEAAGEMSEQEQTLVKDNFYRLISKLLEGSESTMTQLMDEYIQTGCIEIESNIEKLQESIEATKDDKMIESFKSNLVSNQKTLSFKKLMVAIYSDDDVVQDMIDALATPVEAVEAVASGKKDKKDKKDKKKGGK